MIEITQFKPISYFILTHFNIKQHLVSINFDQKPN